jgi:hypothetical protein
LAEARATLLVTLMLHVQGVPDTPWPGNISLYDNVVKSKTAAEREASIDAL